jgi:Ca-activated chloride channel family protein
MPKVDFWIAFALLAIPGVLAQPVRKIDPANQDFTLYAATDLLVLNVGVQDSRGANIKGLAARDFKVYEDGHLQPIKQFSSDERPVTVGIVVDASGSMRRKQAQVVAAALSFVNASNPEDEIFVVNFNDRAELGLPSEIPFSQDLAQIQTALLNKRPEGKTALNDALAIALEQIRKGKWEKKALLLISDGGDNNSIHSSRDILHAVEESGVTLYAIGLFDEDDPDQNPGLLNRLSRITGGEAFMPMEHSQIDSLCRRIAADIRASYTVAYTPPQSDQHTSIRKIKVVVTNPAGGKVTVYNRSSYVLAAH